MTGCFVLPSSGQEEKSEDGLVQIFFEEKRIRHTSIKAS